MCGFCDLWVCVCVGFVMFVSLYVWVFNVWLCVCEFGFCNVSVCVYVVFVLCGGVYVWDF